MFREKIEFTRKILRPIKLLKKTHFCKKGIWKRYVEAGSQRNLELRNDEKNSVTSQKLVRLRIT